MKNQRKLGIPNNFRVFACHHVAYDAHPVMLVFHEYDGEDLWTFTCGKGHADIPENYPVIGIGHVLSADPSLDALLTLPCDWQAERPFLGGPWLERSISE